MKRVIPLFVLSLILLFTSCNKDYDYEIRVGESIVLNLNSSGPGTGYAWQWNIADDVLDTISHEFIPYDENFNGGPGVERWTFVGRRKGITTIKMIYKQPWETEIVDSREYEVRVK